MSVLLVVGIGLLVVAPIGTALHAAVQPAARWTAVDLDVGAWVIVALLVPLAWVLYLGWVRPKLGEARDRAAAARVIGATSPGPSSRPRA